MPIFCKVSCRCVVGFLNPTLFEQFLCRICPTMIWVLVQHFPGSSGESQERGVCMQGHMALVWGLFVQSSQWSSSSDGAAASTPAMPANLRQAASAQRECTKVSLHTVMPAPPVAGPCWKVGLISPFPAAEASM